MTLLRKDEKKYYADLKMSDLNGNKFWKNVKPIFGNKNKGTKTMTLVEGNEAINNDEKILMNISLILF